MKKLILILISTISMNAFAGGIGFTRPLSGINPLTNREIVLSANGSIGQDPLPVTLNGNPGVLTFVSRTLDNDVGETILSIKVGDQTLRGVLSGDCQIAEKMILILPSGAQVFLEAKP